MIKSSISQYKQLRLNDLMNYNLRQNLTMFEGDNKLTKIWATHNCNSEGDELKEIYVYI